MLQFIGSLTDLGLVICVFVLLKMYFNLKKSLKQTDNIVDHNADISIMCFSKQISINDKVNGCLDKLTERVQKLEKPELTKRGDKKDVK